MVAAPTVYASLALLNALHRSVMINHARPDLFKLSKMGIVVRRVFRLTSSAAMEQNTLVLRYFDNMMTFLSGVFV